MGWNDIWKIVLCAVSSAGGIGTIIVLAVKFSSNFIAEQLSKKYELKLQKELEKYKSGLENKMYISKTKFDAEFQLYRELSKAFFEATKDVTIMIPAGYATYPIDEKEREEYEIKLYESAKKSTVVAQDILNANIPFIPKDIYKKYDEIIGLCRIQIMTFEDRWNVGIEGTVKEKSKFKLDDYKLSREIREKFEDINSIVRQYISNLDVID